MKTQIQIALKVLGGIVIIGLFYGLGFLSGSGAVKQEVHCPVDDTDKEILTKVNHILVKLYEERRHAEAVPD